MGWHPVGGRRQAGPDLYFKRLRRDVRQPAAGKQQLPSHCFVRGWQQFGCSRLWRTDLPVHRFRRYVGGNQGSYSKLVWYRIIDQWRNGGGGGSRRGHLHLNERGRQLDPLCRRSQHQLVGHCLISGWQPIGGGGQWRAFFRCRPDLHINRFRRPLDGHQRAQQLLVRTLFFARWHPIDSYGQWRWWPGRWSGFFSTNSGTTWVAAGAPTANWSAIASSADGSKLVATVKGGSIYASTNLGATWTTHGATNQSWSAVASSADGTRLVATIQNGGIYTSTNSGATWASNNVPEPHLVRRRFHSDGSILLTLARSGWSFKSTNGGSSWSELSVPYDFWQSVASSSSGSNLLAASRLGYFIGQPTPGPPGAVEPPQNTVLRVLGTNISQLRYVHFECYQQNLNSHLAATNISSAYSLHQHQSAHLKYRRHNQFSGH